MNSPPTMCHRCGARPIAVSYNDATVDPPISGGFCDPCFHSIAGARIRAVLDQIGAVIPPGTTNEQISQGLFDEMKADTERWAPELAKLTREVEAGLPGGQKNPEFINSLIAKVGAHFEEHKNDGKS